MDDLISRQDAIDIVQGYAEQLQRYIGMPNDSEVYAYARRLLLSIDRYIKALPSAQPEIIRCKDCKYWQDQEDGVVEVPICARPENKFDKHPMIMIIGKDGFCSFAERREK